MALLPSSRSEHDDRGPPLLGQVVHENVLVAENAYVNATHYHDAQ